MAKEIHAIICIEVDDDKGKLDYENLDKQIWDWLVKNTGAHGTHWADPTIHPETGAYAICVELSRMSGALTSEQRERVEILTSDWFPVE